MRNPRDCFLCDKPVEGVTPDARDIFSYQCERCGNVMMTFEATTELRHHRSSRHLISGYTRESTEYDRKPVLIASTNVEKILDSPEIPRNVLDKLHKLLTILGHKSSFPGEIISLDLSNDYPLAYSKNDQEFHFLVQQLEKSGFIDKMDGGWEIRVSGDGWNRLMELEKYAPASDHCFVAMWFEESLETVFEKGIRGQ